MGKDWDKTGMGQGKGQETAGRAQGSPDPWWVIAKSPLPNPWLGLVPHPAAVQGQGLLVLLDTAILENGQNFPGQVPQIQPEPRNKRENSIISLNV